MSMRHGLDSLNQRNRIDSSFTSADVQPYIDYFEDHGTANDNMLAHYLLGRAYHEQGEAPMALQCYQDALAAADTTAADCDYYILVALNGQMADLYHLENLPDNELASLRLAEHYARLDKDTFSVITSFKLMMRPYWLKNQIDSVVFIAHESSRRYREAGYPEAAARVLSTLVNISLDGNRFEEADSMLKIYRSSSGLFDEYGRIARGYELYYYQEGRLQLHLLNYDSASTCFRRALEGGYDEAGYRGLLMLYQDRSVADSIVKYSYLFAAANDNAEMVQKVTAMYNYHNSARIAIQKTAEADRLVYVAAVISALLLFVILASFTFHKRYRRKKNAEILGLIQSYKAAKEALEYAEAKNDTLERQATEGKDQVALLRRQIVNYEAEIRNYSADSIHAAFYDTPVYQRFRNLSRHKLGVRPPSRSDWAVMDETFRRHFPQCHAAIAIDNRLTQDESRVCMLIRIGFTNSDICILMEKEKQGVTNLKAHANQKLFKSNSAKGLLENLKKYS